MTKYPRTVYGPDGSRYGFEMEKGVIVVDTTPPEGYSKPRSPQRLKKDSSLPAPEPVHVPVPVSVGYDEDPSVYYVITEMLRLSRRDVVTGYWTGSEVVADIEAAHHFDTRADAEEVLKDNSFDDPALRVYSETRGMLDFIDMVNQYGNYGGK